MISFPVENVPFQTNTKKKTFQIKMKLCFFPLQSSTTLNNLEYSKLCLFFILFSLNNFCKKLSTFDLAKNGNNYQNCSDLDETFILSMEICKNSLSYNMLFLLINLV